MTTTENNQTPTSPLTWTRKKEWGSEGLTHRASVTIGVDKWSFAVLSPRKGEWVASGWKNGAPVAAFYTQDKTLKGAKELVQKHVAWLETQLVPWDAEPDVTGTLPDGRTVVADHKTDADRCQCEPAPHREDDGSYSHWATCPVAEAQQAEGDSRPSGTDISDLIEIAPIPVADYVATYGTHMPPVDVLRDEAAEALSEALSADDAAQRVSDLTDAFPRLRAVQDSLRGAAENMGQMSAPLATAAEGMAVMAAAVARVQAARDRVQFRKDTCGCRSPLHTMRCGAGGRVRVISSAGAA